MKFQPGLIPRFNNDYNFNDFLYGIKSIFTSNYLGLNRLSVAFDNGDFFFTNNGRSSLFVILRSLNLPSNSKVGVPLYSCIVVFDAIIKAGYIPCFIDIDFSNYTMDPRDLKNKISELSAIVVIHTFGRPADMDEIKKVANGIPIIEDCAHSLLSEYKGKKTGTMGVASFFSLAKYISAGGGGMIIINNKELLENVNKEMSLLSKHEKLNEIKHSIFVYFYSFLYHKPWFGGFAFSIASSLDKKVDISDKKGFEAAKVKKSDLSVFLKKMETFRNKVELQRKNSLILLNELHYTGLILPLEKKDSWSNYFLFPIFFNSKEKRDKACEYLKEKGIDTAKLYNMVPEIARTLYGYKSDCPNAEKLANSVLTIPNNYSLTAKEILKISNIIKKLGELT